MNSVTPPPPLATPLLTKVKWCEWQIGLSIDQFVLFHISHFKAYNYLQWTLDSLRNIKIYYFH